MSRHLTVRYVVFFAICAAFIGAVLFSSCAPRIRPRDRVVDQSIGSPCEVVFYIGDSNSRAYQIYRCVDVEAQVVLYTRRNYGSGIGVVPLSDTALDY